MSDYTPIDCGLYSEYELAIIRRQKLRISWRGDDGLSHMATVTPLDLETRSGAEYLQARDHAGNMLDLRLDHIQDMQPVNASQSSR